MSTPPIGKGTTLIYFGAGLLLVVIQLFRGMTLGAASMMTLLIVYALPLHRLRDPRALNAHDLVSFVGSVAGLYLWVAKSNDPKYGFGLVLTIWSLQGINTPRFWRPPFLDRLWRRERPESRNAPA